MSTEALVNQYAKKPGLDYLFSTKPIRETVSSLVSDHGYAYWDGESGTAYWAGTTEPQAWPHPEPFVDSPDVETSIRDSDVQIGSAFVVYRDIDALVDDHLDEIDRPEQTVATCAECGRRLKTQKVANPTTVRNISPIRPVVPAAKRSLASSCWTNAVAARSASPTSPGRRARR